MRVIPCTLCGVVQERITEHVRTSSLCLFLYIQKVGQLFRLLLRKRLAFFCTIALFLVQFGFEMPSLKKHPVGDYSSLPGTLPSANVPKDLDKASVASACLSQLGNTIQRDALSEDAIWRDTYAFTGTLRTFYGPRSITDTWDKLARIHKPHSFKLVPGAILVLNFGDPVEHSWLQAMFTFETEGELPATCSGFLGITPGSEGDWKIWTLRTMLENFKGLEDVDVPPLGATNGRSMNGLSPSNGVNGGHSEAEASFDVAVVGAGQAGISTAGRLNAMHISNVVLEGNDEIGGNWLSRYDSARCMSALLDTAPYKTDEAG